MRQEMEQNEKMKINLMIADVKYPITIYRKDEAMYREAARLVNEKLNMYRNHRPEGSNMNYMTMIAFEFAFRNLSIESRNDTRPYKEKLDELTREIETRFQEEEQD